LILAVGLRRFLTTFVAIGPANPQTFATVVLIVIAVVAAASLPAAIRAVRMDLARVLRVD
jgi:ABC-type lipoprotein release transport system permease subunit